MEQNIILADKDPIIRGGDISPECQIGRKNSHLRGDQDVVAICFAAFEFPASKAGRILSNLPFPEELGNLWGLAVKRIKKSIMA